MSCAFCGNNSDDVVNLGSLLPIDDIYVHYYCIVSWFAFKPVNIIINFFVAFEYYHKAKWKGR